MNGVCLCISCLCEQLFVGVNSNLVSLLLGCYLCLNWVGVLSNLHCWVVWVAEIVLLWFALAVGFWIVLIWVVVSVGLR